MRIHSRLGRPWRCGQNTVEYMLLIAVIAIAMVVAAEAFLPGFQQGLGAMQGDVSTMVSEGVVGGGS